MAFQIAPSLLLLAFCTSPMLSPSLVEAAQVHHASENRPMISPNRSTPVGTYIGPNTAFPLPVTSHGIYWWVYSSTQVKEYGETFRVLPYVLSYSLPLDPKRIWPGVPLHQIGDLKWNETLDKNLQYSPHVREYLKDWYDTLVEAFKSPDSQKILDYFANEKSFAYIQRPSDVQSVIKERENPPPKSTSWNQPPVNDTTSQPINPITNTLVFPTKVTSEINPIANTPVLPTTVTSATKTLPDPTIATPSGDAYRKNTTTDPTPVSNQTENAATRTDGKSEACVEDEFEDQAPSLVNRLFRDTLSGAKEFEARAVNFFYRLAMNAYLANEEKAKDAIKCVLGLDCSVPSFIKGMLQEQGFSILTRGACTPPGACSQETEEIARTFRDQLATTYPELFNATLDLIRDLGSQNNSMQAGAVTKVAGAGTKPPH